MANLPLVPGIPLPKELKEIDQARIVGLTIDPNVLLSIRRNRIGMMGAKDFSVPLNYAGMQVCCGGVCVVVSHGYGGVGR